LSNAVSTAPNEALQASNILAKQQSTSGVFGHNLGRMHARTFLANQMLIAMPALEDPNFSRSVTYMCQHDAAGAMGIGVSRVANFRLIEVLEQMQINTALPEVAAQPVFLGGPVQNDRGFVLHEPCGEYLSSLRLRGGLCLTTSRDLLEAIAEGEGPKRYLVALGYSGWSEGQLEAELSQNSWLNAPVSRELLFSTPIEQRWQRAAQLLGVSWHAMAGYVGHA
jgi:putative transcriptional regulator